MIRWIKKLFGRYECGYEYWVRLAEIKIMPEFKETPPSYRKMWHKTRYYHKTGKFSSAIKLMRDFTLVDGYTSYLIAQQFDLGKVPVYFVDSK